MAGVLLLVAVILISVYCKNRSELNAAIPDPAPAAYQNQAFQPPGVHTPPNLDQPAIYDAEAARARLVSVQQQSSVTGDSVVYAIPSTTSGADYVADGFYAAGSPGAPGAPGDGNYVDDDFYASAGGAGGVRGSSKIDYATPTEDERTDAFC